MNIPPRYVCVLVPPLPPMEDLSKCFAFKKAKTPQDLVRGKDGVGQRGMADLIGVKEDTMESKINLTHVVPVNYKLTVTLVNQFVISTVQFLNRFASRCDDKLRQVSEGMHRIDITLNILEAKLNSIPAASEQQQQQQQQQHQQQQQPQNQALQQSSQVASQDTSTQGHASIAAPSTATISPSDATGEPHQVSQPHAEPAPVVDEHQAQPAGPLLKDDPRFSKYFKMVKMGVPAAAVKLKMTSEGLDGGFLDMDPDSPAPPMPEGGYVVEPPMDAGSSDEDQDDFSD